MKKGKVVALVPIRSGSKAIKNKNIKLFCGEPLCFWIIRALSLSDEVDTVYVAVDSPYYKAIVESFNLPKVYIYVRSKEDASDSAQTEELMLRFIKEKNLSQDTILLLAQVTSPFTTTEDFTKAIQRYRKSDCDSMLSTVVLKRFLWSDEGKPYNYDPLLRPLRQEWNGSLLENGSFYINQVKNIVAYECRLSGKIATYSLPEWHQYEIDELSDSVIMEHLFIKHVLKKKESTNASSIKLVCLDVDGTLTDGKVSIDNSNNQSVSFSKYDGHAISELISRGIQVAFVTSERFNGPARHRAKRLGVKYFVSSSFDASNKLLDLYTICEREGISLKNVAAIGDDINDIEILSSVGIKACPSTAHHKVKMISGILILSKGGGEGVVREFVDSYLS